MFQFPGSPLHNLLIQLWISGHYPGWVSPFGYPWLTACFRLPMAFRRLLRPSSAPGAKAFTLCSFQLDLTLVLSLRNRSVVSCSRRPTTYSSFFLVLCIVQFSRYISELKMFFGWKLDLVPYPIKPFLWSLKSSVVGSSGLEPPTSRLSGVRSNQLSYEPIT